MTNDKQRADFEAWARSAYKLAADYMFERDDDEYVIDHIQDHWEAWQACDKAREAEIEAMRQRVAELENDYRGMIHVAKTRKHHMDGLSERVKELEAAFSELMSAHDEDIGMDEYPDEDSVGWEGHPGRSEPMRLTFGMLRRARAVLAIDAAISKEGS